MSGWGWLLGSNHSLWGKTEVLCQVDNLHVLRNIVLLQERLALAVTEAEEDDIHLVERHLGGKLQISLAIQSLVNLSHQVAGVTLAVGEYNLCLRMVDKEANQLTSCITSCS